MAKTNKKTSEADVTTSLSKGHHSSGSTPSTGGSYRKNGNVATDLQNSRSFMVNLCKGRVIYSGKPFR